MLAFLFLNRLCAKKRRNALNKERTSNVKRTRTHEKTLYCRTCLNTEDLVPIFHSETSPQKRSEQLQIVTGLEIQINDGLSQKICTQCVEVINVAIRFRRTSKKAEKALLNMSVGIPPKIKLSKSLKIRKFPKKQKLEPEDTSGDYNCDDSFIDDYQNDHDYLVKIEDTKPNVKQFSKAAARTRKRGGGVGASDVSPYKCHTCNKEFKMKATYNSHMRFHTNYCVCESCGKRCRNNNQLQEHKRARHGLGRIHKCAYCEYASATKEALTIHERRHTGERPYICDHCGASFHRRANLVQHIAIHLPDKNFQCDMCPKRLKSRKFLQIHKHNAHTGKRYGYLCPVCGHRFEKPNKARAHSRRVHGLPDDQLGQIVRVQL